MRLRPREHDVESKGAILSIRRGPRIRVTAKIYSLKTAVSIGRFEIEAGQKVQDLSQSAAMSKRKEPVKSTEADEESSSDEV